MSSICQICIVWLLVADDADNVLDEDVLTLPNDDEGNHIKNKTMIQSIYCAKIAWKKLGRVVLIIFCIIYCHHLDYILSNASYIVTAFADHEKKGP